MDNTDKLNSDSYLSLCAAIYDINKSGISNDELLFYFEYVKESKGVILEPMCGTGRFLIPFLEKGFLVEGFDASQAMLDILLRKCASKSLKPKVWKGFLQNLDVKESYGLIFIPDASFNLIRNFEEVRLCIKNVYNHLKIGGKFIFELATLEYMKTITANERKSFSTKLHNGKVIYQNIWVMPFNGRIATTKSYCQLVDEREKVEKIEVEELSLLFHDPGEVDDWLSEVGFSEVKQLKAFDRSQEACEEDVIMVFECVK